MTAEGKSFSVSSPLLVNFCDRKYEVQVEYTIDDGITAAYAYFIGNKQMPV